LVTGLMDTHILTYRQKVTDATDYFTHASAAATAA